MNIQTMIDQIKNGDLRSAMDGIIYLSNVVNSLNNNIQDLTHQLEGKVNTISKIGTSTTTSILGTGFITTAGSISHDTITDTYYQELTGSSPATIFLSQVQIGYEIQIGSVTALVYSIIDDHHLTVVCIDGVTPAFTITANVPFGIIKPSTADTLIGTYAFGAFGGPSGQTFQGVIGANSSLQTYGNMSLLKDVVNVEYVQNSVAPVMALANRSIKRDVDTIYNTNLNFVLGEIQYNGIMDNPYDIVNINQLTTYSTSLNGYYSVCSPNPNGFTGVSNPYHAPLNIYDLSQERNFVNKFFIFDGVKLKCVKNCIMLITINCSSVVNNADNGTDAGTSISVYLDGIVKAYSFGYHYASSDHHSRPSQQPSVTLCQTCEKDQELYIDVGFVGSDGVPSNLYFSASFIAFGI